MSLNLVSLINFTNEWTIFLLAAVLFIRIYKFHKDKLTDFIAATIIGGFTSEVIKYFVNRPRPEMSFIYQSTFEGSSFPSTHVTIAFTIAFFFAITCHGLSKKDRGEGDRYFAILGLFLATMVAILRILTHAHYPVDIFAGIILGFIISLLFVFYDVTLRKIK